jgi:hypothetical protein
MKYEVGKAPEQCSGRRRYFFFAFARVAVFFFAGAFFATFLAAFFTIAALLAIMMAVVEPVPAGIASTTSRLLQDEKKNTVSA